MKKLLVRFLALTMFFPAASCRGKAKVAAPDKLLNPDKVSASPVGKWDGGGNAQDIEFLEDGTFYTYEHGQEKRESPGSYIRNGGNLMTLKRDRDELQIAYNVSDDGKILMYAFTHDLTGKPVAPDMLHMIVLTRESAESKQGK